MERTRREPVSVDDIETPNALPSLGPVGTEGAAQAAVVQLGWLECCGTQRVETRPFLFVCPVCGGVDDWLPPGRVTRQMMEKGWR